MDTLQKTKQHARLSPSDANRWTTCTASIVYEEQLKKQGVIPQEKPADEFASEGTQAHEIAQVWLNRELGNDTAMPEVPSAFAKVEEYVDACLSLVDEDDIAFVECGVDLFYSIKEEGTCDFAVMKADGTCVIRDLKWGFNPVSAKNNKQLAIYASSFIQQHDFKPLNISLGIIQPNLPGNDSVWELSLTELEEFCAKIYEKTLETENGVFMPSELACRWCEAGAVCNARKNTLMKIVSDKDMVEVFKEANHIRSYLKSVESRLYELAIDGKPVTGTKLKQGKRGNKRWVNEGEAIDYLTKYCDPYKRSLVTPTQAMSLIPKSEKKVIDGMVNQSEGKLKIIVDTNAE